MKLHDLPVLWVSGDPLTRPRVEEMLANWHMKPVAVTSGPAAFEAMERAHQNGSPFRLTLVDTDTAGMDGYEIAARVKDNADWSKAAVILFSSDCGRECQKRAKHLGAEALLVKPVSQSDLWDAIVNALPIRGRGKLRGIAAGRKARRAQKRLRILVAEDNPVNQELALHLLERRGHSVIVAENGGQALAALEKHKFDVVLMDVQMPEMGGIEATQLIRAKENSTGGHVPIIAMTAHAMRGDRERCLEAGMDGYLAKPLDPKTFLQTIESAAAGGALRGSNALDPQQPAPANSAGNGGLDESALRARFDGNMKLLKSLAKTFLEDCPRMMARIQKSLKERDPAALAEAAHAFKGSVGNFGPSGAFETARGLEMAARKGTLEGSWGAFATLEDQMAMMRPVLARQGAARSTEGRKRRRSSNHSPRRKR